MKRLKAIEQKASRLVNQTVLDFYGIKLNPKKDLANLDKVTIHAIKQAMIFAVTHRYPDQYDWITDLLVDCVLSFVMHLDPQLVRGEVKTDAQLLLWGKTYICAMLAKNMKSKRKLIICPPVLVDYWKQVLLEFDVAADVRSLGKLYDIIQDEKFLNNIDVVFIDEAHRFRNEDIQELLCPICGGATELNHLME